MAEFPAESSAEVVIDLNEKKPIRVLHVDDESSQPKIAKQCLEKEGPFQVEKVSSVDQALERIKAESYDAIVSDYQMPGKDGLEFLKELRDSGNNIPFIMFTGKGREEVAVKAWNLDADHYVNKNGDPETVYCELAHCLRSTVTKHRAEVQARETTQKLRAIYQNAVEGICYVDPEENLVYVNKAFANILGCSEEELVGMNMCRLVDEQSWAKMRGETKARKEGQSSRYEVTFCRIDGARRGVLISASPLFDSDGCFAGTVCIVLDITERKKAEEELRRFSTAVRTSLDGIITGDLYGNIGDVNDAVLRMYGGTNKSDLIGKSVLDFLVERDRMRALQDSLESVETGQGRTIEYTALTKNGTEIPIEITTAIMRDEQGEPVGFVDIVRNIVEREKLEEELKDSEERLRNLYENIPDSLAVFVGREGRLLHYNKAFKENWLGYTDEELKDKTFLDFVHPDDHAMLLEKYGTKYREEEFPLIYEIKGVNKNGEIAPWEISVGPYKKRGRIIGIEVMYRDITERKKMEEKLRESEERFKDSYEGIQEPVAIYVGREGRLIDYNTAFKESSGYTDEELKGKVFLDFVHPDDRAIVLKNYRTEYPEEKLPLVYEIRGINKKGEIPLEISVSTYKRKGRVVGIEVIHRDITDRKKAERAILENQENFKALFAGNPEAAVHVGPDFCILDVNPRFEMLFGYKLDEIKGRNLNDVVVPKDKIDEAQMLNYRAEQDKHVSHATVRRKKDGSLVPILVSAAQIIVEGRFLGYVAVYKDISDLKRAEVAMSELMQKTAMMNEKLRVTGGLTRHDVRNKLSAITGNVYLLKKQLAGDSSALDKLRDMEAAVEQTVRIFDFAKAYEMLGVEELVYVDVEKTVNEAISLFPDLKNVKLTNDCHGLNVLADSLLRQLFYNLIDNSLKYGQKTTTIRVSFEKTDQHQLKLLYEDDGVGIAQAEKPKLFKEGYSTGGSTGFGLYMIKKMMEVYGWTIEETGEPGRSARFVMTIPYMNLNGKEYYQLR